MQEETFNYLANYNIVYIPLLEDFKSQLTRLLPKNSTFVLSRTNMIFPNKTTFNAQSVVILTESFEISVIPYGVPCDMSDGFVQMAGLNGKVMPIYHFGNDAAKATIVGITKTGWYFYDDETNEYEMLTTELLLWIIDRLGA